MGSRLPPKGEGLEWVLEGPLWCPLSLGVEALAGERQRQLWNGVCGEDEPGRQRDGAMCVWLPSDAPSSEGDGDSGVGQTGDQETRKSRLRMDSASAMSPLPRAHPCPLAGGPVTSTHAASQLLSRSHSSGLWLGRPWAAALQRLRRCQGLEWGGGGCKDCTQGN